MNKISILYQVTEELGLAPVNLKKKVIQPTKPQKILTKTQPKTKQNKLKQNKIKQKLAAPVSLALPFFPKPPMGIQHPL